MLGEGPQTRRRTGSETRALILDAAATEFREQGYDTATLEDVAGRLGVTRSAVLHHFSSKLDILREVVAPLVSALEAVLDDAEAAPPTSGRQRRHLLARIVDALAEHREETAILSRDITAHHALHQALHGERVERAVALLAPNGDPESRLRAHAAMGAVSRPITVGLEIELDAEARKVITDCAFAALRGR